MDERAADVGEPSGEWCISCGDCYPGRVASPCGKVHDCAECAEQRAYAAAENAGDLEHRDTPDRMTST